MGADMAEEITKDSLQLARLEEQFHTIRRDVEDMATQIEEQRKQLAEILERLNEARGGWKVLMLMGGASAALGSSIPWLLQHFKWTP
jgi:phage shock protein A